MTETTPVKFTTLRAFLEDVIGGRMPLEEAIEMLDDIEEGIGLVEHERQLAEAMERLPENDEADPAYRRGLQDGADKFYVSLLPVLKRAEWINGRCPCCGFETVHRSDCLLDKLLIEGRKRESDDAEERKLNDGAPFQEPMG
jgi:hypothetical protein